MTVSGSDRGCTPSIGGMHYITATTRATPTSLYKYTPKHTIYTNW